MGIGEWLSEDPEGDVDSPNLYAYVGQRPNERTDPLGLRIYRKQGLWPHSSTVYREAATESWNELKWLPGDPGKILTDYHYRRDVLSALGSTAYNGIQSLLSTRSPGSAFLLLDG